MKINVGTRLIYGWLELEKGIITQACGSFSIWRGYSLADFANHYQDKKYPVKIYNEDSHKRFPPYYTVEAFLPLVTPQEPSQEAHNANV